MDTTEIMLLAILGVVALVAIAIVARRIADERRRSDQLRRRFGPEYDRSIEQAGDKPRAEAELEARQKRVEALPVRTLTPAEREQLQTRWRAAQAWFVDEPARAIAAADQLVTQGMQARGYPVGDFEQRLADLSVDHANVLAHYRAARRIALASEAGQASTEDLRQAMVHYRALFDDLLAAEPGAPPEKEKV